MSKKKITAPLSYDPGKGRPKEFLAYLNWHEMQALRRLNGHNTERGPMGLPSFPPADAVGSGQTPGTGNWTGAPGGTSTGAGGTTGGGSESGNLGGVGGQTSPSAASTAAANAAQAAQNADTSAEESAAAKNTADAARNAAYRQDIAKGGISDLNSDAQERNVTFGNGQISGAIASVAQPAYTPSPAALGAVTRGPGSVSGMIPGNTDPVAQLRSIQGITNSFNDTFGTNYSPSEVSGLARTIAGEAAGESRFGKAAVANTMMNRISLAQADPSNYGYMGGTSPTKLMSQYDATGLRPGTTQNAAYKSALPGTANYQAGLTALSDAMNPNSNFSKTASPQVLSATHYYNPATSNPDWGVRSGANFESVGNHVFGNAEPTASVVSEVRSIGSEIPEDAESKLASTENSYNPGVAQDPAAMAVLGGIANIPKVLGNIRIPSLQEATPAQKAERQAALAKISWMPESLRNAAIAKFAAPQISAAIDDSGFNFKNAASAGITALQNALTPQTSVATKQFQDQLMTVNGVTSEVSPEQFAALDPADQARISAAKQGPRYTTDPNGIISPEEDTIVEEEQNYKLMPNVQDRPVYETPEQQKIIADQAKKNKIGVNVIERAPILGGPVTVVEGIQKLFTGKGIADYATAMKHAYIQADEDQQAAMRAKYPDMYRFAVSIGDIPPRAGNQYAAYTGGTPVQELGGKSYQDYGGSFGGGTANAAYAPTGFEPVSTDRPSQYYLWDLGVGIPSPGDPDYNDYQKYLKTHGSSTDV